MGTTNTIVDFLCNIIITIPGLVSSEKFQIEIVNEIEEIDWILSSKYKRNFQEQNNRGYYVHLVFLNILYIGLLLNNAFFWLEPGHYIQFYIFDQFYRYRATVSTLYIYDLVKRFLQRFTALNEVLEGSLESICTKNSIEKIEMNRLVEMISDVSKLHAKFLNIIKNFNDIFGWPIFAILVNYVLLFIVAYETIIRMAWKRFENVSWRMHAWHLWMIYSTVRLGLKARIFACV